MDKKELRKRIVTIDGLVVADKEKTTCSFCKRNLKMVVRSNLSGGSICAECLYHAQEVMGAFPPGAVLCQACHKWDRFILHYKKPVGTASFMVLCLDEKGQPVYALEAATFSWRMGLKPAKATCGHCYGKLQAWVLNKNSYVKHAHSKKHR